MKTKILILIVISAAITFSFTVSKSSNKESLQIKTPAKNKTEQSIGFISEDKL